MCRDVTGREGDRGDEDCCDRERQRIVWGDIPELSRQEPVRSEACHDTGNDSGGDEADRGPEHDRIDVRPRRTECDADRDLLLLARNGVSRQAEDANGDQHDARDGEDAEDEQAESRLRVERAIEDLGQRARLYDRNLPVDGREFVADALQDACRIAGSAHQQRRRSSDGARPRQVYLWIRRQP